MFVCVHDLEYVSDTGSLFICPGTRWKDWGNLPSGSACPHSLGEALLLAASQRGSPWVQDGHREGLGLLGRRCAGRPGAAGQLCHCFCYCVLEHACNKVEPSHLRGCAVPLPMHPFLYQSW